MQGYLKNKLTKLMKYSSFEEIILAKPVKNFCSFYEFESLLSIYKRKIILLPDTPTLFRSSQMPGQ
jgi:ASC-1-like (ASCH) protein